MLDRGGACALDDVALLPVVARRDAGVALDLADLLRERLALGDEREDVAIDLTELVRSGSSFVRASSGDMRPNVLTLTGVANAARALQVVRAPALQRAERVVGSDDDAVGDRGRRATRSIASPSSRHIAPTWPA